jgi:hypothetical protein
VVDPRHSVTSPASPTYLGQLATMVDVQIALRQTFAEVFGPKNRASRKRRFDSRC